MNDELSYSFRGKDGARIRVTVEPSLGQPNVCRFIIEPEIYPGAGVRLLRESDLSVSPLAEALFEQPEITEVLIAGNTLTLTTEEPVPWDDFSSSIAERVRDQLNSGVPAVSDAFTKTLPSPEIIGERVRGVLDADINPSVASHGGVVTLLDVRGNNVFLEFGGGCQGCGMVSVTLKYGVERLIRERVPEVGQILDTTDHAAGTNPYYAPSAK